MLLMGPVSARRVALVAMCLLVNVTGSGAGVGWARQPSVTGVRQELAELSEQESRLAGELAAAQEADAKIAEQVSLNEGRVDEIATSLAVANEAVTAAEASAQAGAIALADSRRREAAQREELVASLVARYAGAPLSLGLPTVTELKGDGAREILARMAYGETISRIQDRMLAALHAESARQQRLSKQLDADRELARERRDEVARQQLELKRQRSLLDVLRAEAQKRAGATEDLLAEVERQRGESLARVASLAADSLNLGNTLRELQTRAPLASVPDSRSASTLEVVIPRSPTRGIFLDPGSQDTRSSGFGMRTHPLFGDVRMHSGEDYALSAGSGIRAAGAGVVLIAQQWGGYGLMTVIDHGSGVATVYAHQSDVIVKAGARVSAGEVIGAVGSTGYSTGPHLHFEVRVDGEPTDPLLWLGR